MWSWLHWLGLGPSCHRCGVMVTHRPDLFRISDRQCCAECYFTLKELQDQHELEETTRQRIRYGGAWTSGRT